MTDTKTERLVDRVALELSDYRYSAITSSALAEHILAIPAIHDALKADWRTMDSAPVNKPVQIQLGEGMTIVARLLPGAAMNSEQEPCDQWQAEHKGEHPECWHDGVCWESNADECTSLQPRAWRPL
jgi:hypothetical protein